MRRFSSLFAFASLGLLSCGDQWVGPQPSGEAYIKRLARGSASEPAARLEVTSTDFVFTTTRRVARGKLTGGNLETIDENNDERGDLLPTSLAADDKAVYYAKRKTGTVSIGISHPGSQPDVTPMLTEGGALTLVSTGEQLYAGRETGEILRLDSASHIVASGPAGPFQLVVDDERVVWVSGAGGFSTIARLTRPLGTETPDPPLTLAEAPSQFGGVVLDDASCAFFTDTNAGTINMVWKDGGAFDVMAKGRGRPTWIAFDKDHGEVVWVEATTHELFVMSTAITPVGYEGPRRLVTGLGEVVALRVRDGKVYWAEEEGIYVVSRPAVKAAAKGDL